MKLKLYTNYSPSHKVLYDNYFIKTLPENEFEVVLEECPQDCLSGNCWEAGWEESCIRKLKIVLNACKSNMGGAFVFSDVDVQFFGPVLNVLLEELGDLEIACQNDTGPTYCAGFFIAKANDNTLKLFEDMLYKFEKDDQHCLNKYIHINKIKAKMLSSRFLTIGNLIYRVWNESIGDVYIPRNTLVHHANFTVGVENKIKLLNMVRKQLGYE